MNSVKVVICRIQNYCSTFKKLILLGCFFSLSVSARSSCISSYQTGIVDLQFEVWQDSDKVKIKKMENQIVKASLSQIYYLGTGMTETYLVKFSSLFSGIFKPYPEFWRHKNKAKSFATNPKAEVLSYKLSELTGLANVPFTFLTEVKGMKGSVQLFIPRNEDENSFSTAGDLNELKLFDYLINNTDRRADNILQSGKILVAIDHSQSLKVNKAAVVSEQELQKSVQSLSEIKRHRLQLLTSEALLAISENLISAEEQQALLERFHKIKKYL